MMNVILLSGGSGKRLWPLSNEVRSKQFLKLFKNGEGQYESMLQRVYRQLLEADPTASVTIATSKTQVSSIRSQLGDGVGISLEPCRRDTFPAIALAAAYLHDILGIPSEETVVVCPVDPYVESGYFTTLKHLSERAATGEAGLVLMGIEPTYPSEKYGYIIPDSKDPISAVSRFQEKPDVETARHYIAQGALWNGGVFACRLSYVLGKARDLLGYTDYQNLFDRYETFPKISFDYAVVEKEPRIQVIRYRGAWKDLGTWNTLTEAMEENTVGDGIRSEACSDVHIINELNLPVLAMGLHDVVISLSPDGVLVSDKTQSSYIKPFVDSIEREAMFAEKSWGSYRVIDVDDGSMTIKVTLRPNCRMNYHSHLHRSEAWVVTGGEGKAVVDGMEQEVRPGDVITMEAGCRHTVIAKTELRIVEIQLGREISVQDKRKYPLDL